MNLFKSPNNFSSTSEVKKLISESTKKRLERDKLFKVSPLDRLRSGINDRAVALGLPTNFNKSFELNQSFPLTSIRNSRRYELIPDPLKTTPPTNTMEKVRVDGANGLRFSARRNRGCFTPGTGSPYNSSFMNPASESIMRIPKSGINPNKAVFTIDSKSSQILIVNYNACQILGYSSKELCSMQFSNLLVSKKKHHVSALAEGQLNSEDGTMVLLSGKVVEMNTKMGSKLAVSLWIRQIDTEGRCLAVAEPVERRIAELIIDQDGYVLNGDYEALILFQLDSEEKLNGMEISTLIPAVQLPNYAVDAGAIPKTIRKQKATGKTQDGVSFPLCLLVTEFDCETDKCDVDVSNLIPGNNYYLITIWVFTNLSGLIVIDENGVVESCNHHFSMLMFGFSEHKMLGQYITKIIPNFGQEFQYLGYRSRNATISSTGEESDTETDPICVGLESDANSSNVITAPMPILSMSTSKICLDFTHSSNSTLPKMPNIIQPVVTTDGTKDTELQLHKDENSTNPIVNSCMINDLTLNETHNNEIELLTPVNEGVAADVSIIDYVQTEVPATNSAHTNINTITTPKLEILNDNKADAHFITSTPGITSAEYENDEGGGYSSAVDSSLINNSGEINENCDKNDGESIGGNPFKKLFVDGNYKGEAIHNDGNIIDIIYTISCQTIPCGRKVYCVWISRDPDSEDYDFFDDDDERHQNLTLTFNSGNSQVDSSLGQAIQKTAAQNSSRPNSLSLMSQCEEEQISGEFAEHYTTLKQIGKGAYGYVKMAYRNTDRLLVIAKFILKEKLCSQFMIITDDNKEVPMEIYLLSTVKHPNIVTVYDVFENEKFFQLVMEKHGSGMDLFEFIDRRPLMEERLACFIFRQIANAVDYLHSLNILHRDIKDENIIIDHNFHVKLIDFGSATFMQEGKLFSTFFGTTEYCSPEVLAGNKYAGPELEMWALGVTLYVLIFFENPFLDIEETLRADLRFPHRITPNLESLLISMLDKNPKTRCTMKCLMDDVWLNQEINPNSFNFENIVRCEAYESNPEKYYIGQKFSSATVLSTASPQDSLSLVDDDSIIDGDDAEDEDKSIPSQDHNSGFKSESHASVAYSESVGSVSSSHLLNTDTSNASTNLSNSANKIEPINKIDCINDADNNDLGPICSLEIIEISDNSSYECYEDDSWEDENEK